MANDIGSFELNTGAKIPSVGLGTWQAAPGVVGDAVAAAVKVRLRILVIKLEIRLNCITIETLSFSFRRLVISILIVLPDMAMKLR